MRKVYCILIVLIMSLVGVFAGDTLKVLQVYIGKEKTTIPLLAIDSLDHIVSDGSPSESISSVIHAIDRDYQLPTASIDSIVIGEINVQQFEEQINSIKDYIEGQTEQDVDIFQKNLLAWINANENFQEATINESKDLITIILKNGLDFYISFQDMTFFEDTKSKAQINENAYVNRASSKKNYYFVGEEEGETIIEKTKVLYIKGMEMSFSNAEEEYNYIIEQKELSPIEIDIKNYNCSLLFADELFPDYGLIIISQTHGNKLAYGAFQIEDKISANQGGVLAQFYNNRGWQIYTENRDNQHCIVKGIGVPIFIIHPKLISKRIKGCNTIVYGSYCWSYGFSTFCDNNTVFGYDTPSAYFKNSEYLREYVKNLFFGATYEKAIEGLVDYDEWMWYDGDFQKVNVKTKTNFENSKQRYFSISTDEIKQLDEKERPIITGKINGYDNLKKDELVKNFRLYVHEGDKSFTPSSSNVKNTAEGITISPNGEIECIYPGSLNVDKTYSFIIGFEYKNNIYYGEQKSFYVDDKYCPDSNHPHMIDLGLPSGTKWACCNVGAHAPEEFGGYYSWGETEEKDSYGSKDYLYSGIDLGNDISGTDKDVAHVHPDWGNSWQMPRKKDFEELNAECEFKRVNHNGVSGYKTIGPNGNKVFLPLTGVVFKTNINPYYVEERGSAGYYWSSTSGCIFRITPLTSRNKWITTSIERVARHRGMTVRPVSK